jgi:hypothetical protein
MVRNVVNLEVAYFGKSDSRHFACNWAGLVCQIDTLGNSFPRPRQQMVFGFHIIDGCLPQR